MNTVLHLLPGDVLANGARVLAHTGNYVLAFWRTEYVTWRVYNDLSCEAGHYFRFGPATGYGSQSAALVAAAQDLAKRSNR